MDARFTISTDDQVIDPICDFTYRWCLNYGLSEGEALRFSVAISELITDVILFAFPSSSQESFEIEYYHTFSNLEVIICEMGEPFDPDRHSYDAEKALTENNFEGAGFLLIRSFSDEFSFINKGKEGKEFRLLKNIKIRDIDELLEQPASLREVDKDRKDEENSQKQLKEFTVNRIKPADAEDISKIFYRTYQYSYFKEDMYLPKKIEKAVLSKDKLGVIARKINGEAIGYFGVMQKEGSNIAEVGEAVVSPRYRRNGVMSSMMSRLIKILEDREVTALFAKAVTNHPVSQKVNHKFGYKTTALILTISDKVKYKGFDEEYPQPVSAALDFLPIINSSKKPVYVPARYKEIILQTYDKLDMEVEPRQPSSSQLAEKSDIDLNVDYPNSTLEIVVHEYGSDFLTALSDIVNSFEQNDLHSIYLDLPLENKATPEQVSKISSLNFIYSGLAPQFYRDADYLRLQKVYLNIDFSIIEVYSEFGKEIKSFVENEYNKHIQGK